MKTGFLVILITAFLLRIAFVFSAYHGDLNNNISWGQMAVTRGLRDLYNGQSWPFSAPNQPPLYILLFAACVWVFEALKSVAWSLNRAISVFPSGFIWFWEQKGMVLLVKLPSILADLGIGYLIYRYFEKKPAYAKASAGKLGLILASVWLVNPVSWYNSAIWGQTDAIVNFLGLLAIWSLLEKKLTTFFLLLATSVLFKGSLVLFIPILFVVALLQKHSLQKWVFAIVCSLLVVTATSIWFHPAIDLPLWLFKLYTKRIFPGEIGFLTANAFNFWWLVDPGRTLDSTVYFGLPARIWGLIATGVGMVGSIFWLVRGKLSDKKVFWTLAILALVTFLFMTRIHERYMYPFFPYATMLLGGSPFIIPIYVLLTTTHLLNLYHLFWYPPFPALEALYKVSWFPSALSVSNLILFAFLLRHLKASKI